MAFAAYEKSRLEAALAKANDDPNAAPVTVEHSRMKTMRDWKGLTLEERSMYGEIKVKKVVVKKIKKEVKEVKATLSGVMTMLKDDDVVSAAKMLQTYIDDNADGEVDEKEKGKGKGKGRNSKDQDKDKKETEKKPPTLYNKFMKKKMGELKIDKPEIDSKDRMKEMALSWKSMSVAEKDAYVEGL